MGKRVRKMLVAAAVLAGLTAGISAQTPKQAAAPKNAAAATMPDISGVWGEHTHTEGMDGLPGDNDAKQEAMALTPWATTQWNYNRDPLNPRPRGRNELDPSSHCFPPGPVRLIMGAGGNAGPVEIIQTPKKVTILYEQDHSIRQIFTDGREHPKDLDLSWNGHSIGKWDGDTLVVDTIKIREETWLDGAGHAHSDQLHVVERYKRIDRDTLEINLTLTDPKTFTKPWNHRVTYQWRPDLEIMENVTCDEHYKKGIFYGEGPAGL
jgi:hypothetical protein